MDQQNSTSNSTSERSLFDNDNRRYQPRRGNDDNTMPTRENSSEDAGNSEMTVWSFREDDVGDSSSARKKPEKCVKDEIDGSTERCSGEHISDSSNEMKTKNSSQVQDTVPVSSEASRTGSRTGGVERTDVARVEADVASVEDDNDDEEFEIVAVPLEHVAHGILEKCGWEEGRAISRRLKEKPDVKPYQPKHLVKFPDSGIERTDMASVEADVASVEDDNDDEEFDIVAFPLELVARSILEKCGWKEGQAISRRLKEKPDVKPYQPKHIGKSPDSCGQSNDVVRVEANGASVEDDNDEEVSDIVAVPLEHVARSILEKCVWEEGRAISRRLKEKPDGKPYQVPT